MHVHQKDMYRYRQHLRPLRRQNIHLLIFSVIDKLADDGFDAVYLAFGAHKGIDLKIQGQGKAIFRLS